MNMSAPPAPSMRQPIRHLVILGHPDPDSFCGSVAQTYCDTVREFGQDATLRDLYALDFDPALRRDELPRHGSKPKAATDLAEELALLGEADVIVLVYPIWFGMPPAIIKGYVDRVLGAGFVPRDITRGTQHPILNGKRLALFTSSATTRPWLEEKGQWLALRHAFETYLQMVFSLREGGHVHFDAVVPGLKQRFVDEYLAEVAAAAKKQAADLFEERRALKIASHRARAFARQVKETAASC